MSEIDELDQRLIELRLEDSPPIHSSRKMGLIAKNAGLFNRIADLYSNEDTESAEEITDLIKEQDNSPELL